MPTTNPLPLGPLYRRPKTAQTSRRVSRASCSLGIHEQLPGVTCSKQNPRCERRRWRLSRGRPVKALLSQGEVVGFARCLQCQRRQIKARRLPASRGSVCEALVHKRRFTGSRRQTGSSRSFQRARVPQTNVLFPRGSLPPTLPIPPLPLLHHPFPLVSPYPPHIPPLPSSCLIPPPPRSPPPRLLVPLHPYSFSWIAIGPCATLLSVWEMGSFYALLFFLSMKECRRKHFPPRATVLTFPQCQHCRSHIRALDRGTARLLQNLIYNTICAADLARLHCDAHRLTFAIWSLRSDKTCICIL